MSQDVVATIAGLAARETPGIHALGRSRLIAFGGDKPSRGVGAEVGNREAALDLEVVIDYGCDIRQVAGQLRERIAAEVDRMAGRKVVEVNINVVGIAMPTGEKKEPPPSRVQ
ncbi:MAG: Asp23/Gls24 family envelope stress response protein [Deltaproteobacteria bacterium]|nr:Asp23/Gls24 family envelope stress response protein [Deltaproteobacteria bacterium]